MKLILLFLATLISCGSLSAQQTSIKSLTSVHPAGAPILLDFTISNTGNVPVVCDLGYDQWGNIEFRDGPNVFALGETSSNGGISIPGEVTLQSGDSHKLVLLLDDWTEPEIGQHNIEISLKGQKLPLPASITLEIVEPSSDVSNIYVKELLANAIAEKNGSYRQSYFAALSKVLASRSEMSTLLEAYIKKNPELKPEIDLARQIEASRKRAID